MAKQYYIKKDTTISGADIEWIAINGKEFYQLITSPAGKGRYFIDMDDFMIETNEEDYLDWRKEKNHSDYLHSHDPENPPLSFYSDLITEDGNGEEVVCDELESTEEQVLHSLELEELKRALKMLEQSEYMLVYKLFLSPKCKTQIELTQELCLTQAGISRQKKRILEKLKFLVIKSKKVSNSKVRGKIRETPLVLFDNFISEDLDTFLTGPLDERGQRR